MNSEVIYYRESNWRGRYGDSHRKDVTIGADFTSPAEWPYTIKKVHVTYSGGERTPESETIKLPRELYLRIREIIVEAMPLLDECEEEIDNGSMDGTGEAYTFTVDGSSKLIRGDSIYGQGSWEAEQAESRRGDSYTVYAVVKKIEDALAAANVSLW